MSSAADIYAYDHSVTADQNETLFSGKKWTYIQDSTSNTGQYQGQIQFNLSTISSQAAFVNWEEAVIELPIKLQILNGGAAFEPAAAPTVDQLVPKAGAWQFIDSVQVVIDGVTVQTNQVHENVNATFKALTEWSTNDQLKYGATSNFALDRFEPPVPACPQSLDNLPTADFVTIGASTDPGVNVLGEFGMANTFLNAGARERAKFTAFEQKETSLAFDVMGKNANVQVVAKPQVWTWATGDGAVAPGGPIYVAHYLATIKLADVCDYFKKCPMQKNTRGFIYINYNSSSTTIVSKETGGIVGPTTVASVSNNMNFGNTCPILYNLTSAAITNNYTTRTGLAVQAAVTTLTVTADVNGTETKGTGLNPSQTFSRLLVPTYTPNPMADGALTQKKTFRYFERMTNKFTVLPNSSFTWTLTNGIANPRKLFMQPIITSWAKTGTVMADAINPLRSPFTTIPATTSPFASIKQLQVTVGNIPCWNNPIDFGYDMFLQEMAPSGVAGGLDDTTSSGLLSQQSWESLHRFIAVDVGRRLPSEDGASKSIIVSGTNNTTFPLTIYYHIWRDAIATVDTAMGTVSQTPVQK